MTHYGSITIDNKNLLDDLLGLEGEYGDVTPVPQQKQQFSRPVNKNTQAINDQIQGRKQFLESPTFTKGEDDIYR